MITTNLSCPRGASREISVAVEDAAGDPVDITGWTVVFELLSAWEEYPALVTHAGTIDDGPGGVCSATFTTSETRRTPGLYRWSASRTDSGLEDVLASGTFQILGPKLAGITV